MDLEMGKGYTQRLFRITAFAVLSMTLNKKK